MQTQEEKFLALGSAINGVDLEMLIELLSTYDCRDVLSNPEYGKELAYLALYNDIDLELENSDSFVVALMNHGYDLNTEDNDGNTLMHDYIRFSNYTWEEMAAAELEELEELENHYRYIVNKANMYYRLGANILHPNDAGETPISLRSEGNSILQDAYVHEIMRNSRSRLDQLPYIGALKDMLI